MPAAWANRCSLKRLHLSNRSTRTLGSGSWIRSKLRAPDPAERPPTEDTRITKPRQSTLIGRQWTPSIRIVDRDLAPSPHGGSDVHARPVSARSHPRFRPCHAGPSHLFHRRAGPRDGRSRRGGAIALLLGGPHRSLGRAGSGR